jgi:hypothetical protein
MGYVGFLTLCRIEHREDTMGRSRRHGVRRHVVSNVCPHGKTSFTTWDAAKGALARAKDAIRVYRGSCCGYFHITKYTEDEYAQRVAQFACTNREDYDTVDLTDEDTEGAYDERREQSPRASDAAAAAIKRVWQARQPA